MSAARGLVLVVVCCALAACTTRTIATSPPRIVRAGAGPAPPPTQAQSFYGYIEGELILTFTPEGERTVASTVGRPPTKLRFGVLSLDRLNAKYRATQLVKVADVQGGYLLRIAPDANVFRAVEEYKKDPLVAGADLHYMMRLPAAQAPDAVRTQTGPLKRNRPSGQPSPH
jgi:hypothetical protein